MTVLTEHKHFLTPWVVTFEAWVTSMGMKPLTLALCSSHWATQSCKQSSRLDGRPYFISRHLIHLDYGFVCSMFQTYCSSQGCCGCCDRRQRWDGGPAVIIYVFRSQLHSKHSSGNKYGSMQNTSTTSIKGFKMHALQRESCCVLLFARKQQWHIKHTNSFTSRCCTAWPKSGDMIQTRG